MDFVDRLSNAFGGPGARGGISFDSVLKFHDISPRVQAHLGKVYLTLAAALAVSSLGTAFSIYTGLGGFLAVIGFMVCVPWLLSVPAAPGMLRKRQMLLGGAAFSQGMLLGPLVNVAIQVHPGTLITALLGTSVVFACFTGAALLSKRRSYLYLGGLLSSAMSTLMLMRMATWFFGGQALLFQLELFGGLALFAGYTIVDSQMIVERAEAGDLDPIRGALDLFIDFMALFTRILIILLRNAEQRQQQRGEREERSSKRRR